MNPKAMVTGATSGIGAEYARRLAKEGYDLILTGRRMERLRIFAQELESSFGVKCEALQADFSGEEGIAEAERAIRSSGGLEFLFNNAGFGNYDSFLDSPVERHAEMIRVHDEAPVRLTYAALPAMLARGRGTVVFTSSVAAFAARPGPCLYTASKAFINGFARCLDMTYYGKGLKFQALCPGFTHTDFHERVGIGREKQVNRGYYRWMETPEVVERSWKDLAKGRLISVPGFFNRFLIFLTGVLPKAIMYRVVGAGKKSGLAPNFK